uniref:Uncharacterized protein n=1 Tax=Timema cristinae TaxID=61476 RepID=A0A7R9CAV6_TIMCR|nr:unnamed protein product [Timema cristinae]
MQLDMIEIKSRILEVQTEQYYKFETDIKLTRWEDAPVLDLIVDKEQQKENKESDREQRENKRSRTSSRSRSILK